MQTRTRKWIRRSLFGLLIVLALALPAAYFVGLVWLESRLEQGIRMGEAELVLRELRITPRLRLTADSALYLSPGAAVLTDRLAGDLDFFRGFLIWKPRLQVTLGEVLVRMEPADTSAPWPDSMAFPGFGIPIEARIMVDSLLLTQDGRRLAAVHDLLLYNTGAKRASLRADFAMGRRQRPLRISLEADADWSPERFVSFDAKLRREGDFIFLTGRHRKRNLLVGRDTLEAYVQTTEPYAETFHLAQALPLLRGLRLWTHVDIDSTYRVLGGLRTELVRYEGTPLALQEPLRLNLRVAAEDSAGEWNMRTTGPGGPAL